MLAIKQSDEKLGSKKKRTKLTLRLCRSETEVRCWMHGMQEAQVMQVMQNQRKVRGRRRRRRSLGGAIHLLTQGGE